MSKIKLPDGVGIAIQGPTDWVDYAINFWPQFDCPITWGTWSDEPVRNILKIERAGIEVVISDKPKFHGMLNCNLQFLSSYSAINTLSNYNVQHVLKIRGDCLLYGLEKIWPVGEDISFMHSYNPKNAPELAYYLDGKYHLGIDFPLDHAIFGNIRTLLQVFDMYEGYPRMVPPESIILKRWLDLNNIECIFEPEFLKTKGVHYWGPSAVQNDARLMWLKNNWDMTAILFNEPHIRIY